MKYAISEGELKLREYGRNVQLMVDYMKTVEDKALRTRIAHEIVRIMASLHPDIKSQPNYKETLWDHLYVIADFELDVDAPYPFPTREEFENRTPPKPDYPNDPPGYRQYGRNVELLIEQIKQLPDGKAKDDLVNIVASMMKEARSGGRDNAPDDTIAKHLGEISGGELARNTDDIDFNRLAPPRGRKPFVPDNGIRIKPKKKKNNKRKKRSNKRRRRR